MLRNSPPSLVMHAIGHERFVALHEDLAQAVRSTYALAHRPAPFEIGRLADRVVLGAGEAEVAVNGSSTSAAVLSTGRRRTCRG